MFEDYYMPEFDADYFNSPAFQRGIAAAVQQYSPQPAEPVYYAPEPVYYAPPPAPEITAGIGDIPQYMVDDYGLIGGAPDRFTAPQISDEQLAAERYAADQAAQQAEAQRVAAEQAAAEQAAAQQAAAAAEAQRVAAEQEYFARVEAERVAAERAAAAEAAAQRQQTELNERRAQAAQAAAERAAQERAFAEQAAAQAAAEAQAAAQAQAQAAAQAEAQRVAAERAQAEAQAAAQVEAQRVAAAQAQAEQARVQAEQAAAVAPAPEPVVNIGRSVDENFYVSEVQAPEQTYTPAPVAAPETDIVRGIGGREVSVEPDYGFAPEQIYVPEPVPVYAPPSAPAYYEPAPVAGIGREVNYNDSEQVLSPEPVYTPAAEPMTIEAAPVAGIGSTAAAAPAEAPSLIETAAAAPAAGAPLTQEQYDALADRRAAANALPRGTYIAAPTDNLGKATGFNTPGEEENTFQYRGGPIRVTDRKGKVLFSGEGPEAALEAVKFAQNLSDTKGKKASWDIQQGERTINPDGSVGDMRWVSGPTDAKEGMGVVGDLAKFALPIAAAVLTAGMSLPAQMAIASAAGMVGGVMSGNDPLKSAIIAGVSAGVMDKIGANEFIGKALNSASSAVTNAFASEVAQEGAKEVVKNAVAELGEEIVVTAISKTMQGVANSVGNTLLAEVAKGAGLGDITGYQTPAEKFAEEQLPETLQTSTQPPVEDAIVVSGNRIGAVADTAADVITGIGSGAAADVVDTELFDTEPPAEETIVVSGERTNPVADVVADVVNGIGNVAATDVINAMDTPAEKFVEEPLPEELGSDTQPPAEDTIVVSGTRVTPAADAVTGAISGIGTPGFIDPITGDIVVSKPQPEPVTEETEVAGIGTPGVVDPVSGDIVVSKPKPEPEAVTKEEVLPEGSVVATLPLTGIPTPDPALTDPKSTLEKVKDAVDIATTVLPIIGGVVGGGGGDDDGPLVPSGGRYDVNPNRSDIFGMRRPATIGFNPFTYGQATGDQPGEYLFFTRDPVTGAPTIPAPITTPTANEPAGPAMILPSDNTFAEGGEVDDDMAAHLMAYHKNGGHTGPGQVKGIGSGQEDKIPAWLSDGEYVWSAQDVADLGDGSTDEGVRRLDKMRQMVRRRAGRKDVKKIAKPQKGIDHMLKAVGGSV